MCSINSACITSETKIQNSNSNNQYIKLEATLTIIIPQIITKSSRFRQQKEGRIPSIYENLTEVPASKKLPVMRKQSSPCFNRIDGLTGSTVWNPLQLKIMFLQGHLQLLVMTKFHCACLGPISWLGSTGIEVGKRLRATTKPYKFHESISTRKKKEFRWVRNASPWITKPISLLNNIAYKSCVNVYKRELLYTFVVCKNNRQCELFKNDYIHLLLGHKVVVEKYR